MSVPFFDLAHAHAELQPEIEAAILRVLASSQFIGGPEVEAFEEDFARFTGATHCIGLGNGLDALRLALMASGIGPGDEVIVPSHTFIATWLAVSQCGALPVPVEADSTMNMDPAKIEAALTPATRAIVPVHLYGRPAELDEIHAVAARHGLVVVEDAAQAHGARYRGRRIGAHSPLVAWSFYPGKNLGALGDGGAVTTNDAQLAAQLRLLRNYGSRRKYEHLVPGVNSRLDAMQAAVLRVKLRHLERWNARRTALARTYASALTDLGIEMPVTRPHVEPSWHLFAIRHPRRDELQRQLTREGIETLVHYPCPCHLQPAYATLRARMPDLGATERLASEVLSLPMGPHVHDEQATRVLEVVASFCRTSATA